MNKKFLALICFLILLTGCAMLPVEEALPPPVFYIEVLEFSPWSTAPAGRGDVELTAGFSMQNLLLAYESVFFSVAGLPVANIFVSVGDEVRPGDIIARLYQEGLDEQLEEMNREAAVLNLALSQNAALRENSRRMAEATGIPMDDSRYGAQREELQGQLGVVQAVLAYLNRQDETLNARAETAGTVRQVMELTEDLTSTLSGRVATISSQEEYIFRANHIAAAAMLPGDRLEMMVLQGDGRHTVILEKLDPDATDFELPVLGPTQALFVVVGGDPVVFLPNTTGAVTNIYAEARDVIKIPRRAVNTVGERTFVYVLENDMRRLRWVETGVADHNYIEIVSGLEEGELIVL
ncbi:MAG: biotin/lipoyl-binding protein [Defluviitaleaceae bacterium]|nr:biotin/lipoyl-binding protein [Defluviitaleaceae bacterium]